MKSFLSLLSERREMRASAKCHPEFGCGIEPRASCTIGLCPTDAPLHILLINISVLIWIWFTQGDCVCILTYGRLRSFDFRFDLNKSIKF